MEQKCHVLVTTLYNLNLACQHILMEGKLKILGTKLKSEEILHVHLTFCAFEDFYYDNIYANDRKHPCLVGVY